MAFYAPKPTHYAGVEWSDLERTFLTLTGANRYPKAFHFISGKRNAPAGACQGDEQTGFYWPATGIFGVTCTGWDCVWFEALKFTLFNKRTGSVAVSIDPLETNSVSTTLPDTDGRLLVADYFISEALTGTVDGVNDEFTTTEEIAKVLDLQLDGVGGQSYSSATGTTITFTTPPAIGTVPRAIYIRT